MRDILLLGFEPVNKSMPVETCYRCGKPPAMWLLMLGTDEEDLPPVPIIQLCNSCLTTKSSTMLDAADKVREHGSVLAAAKASGVEEL
jgi:hypothetical protein